jgi:predicted KAP-like P-loop ATPase
MDTNEAILTDTPLENPKEDRLGFAPFAKNLADAIFKVSAEECLIIALYGQWGTGKTTILNFILHYINKKTKDRRPIVIRFNPWWFSGHGELLEQFLKEVRIALGKEPKFKGVVKDLAAFTGVVSKLPEPNVKLWGGIVTWLLRLLGKDKEAWQLRDEIRKNLKQQRCRILIVIDDIDRLPVEEIRSIFRVIKAVADFPKTVYLLAFDKSVVTKALEEFQGITGESYLEKIIQVPFDLPMPDKAALRRLFFEQLTIILSGTPDELFDQTYWGNVFWDGIDHFLNTIRNVNRLTNVLKIAYPAVKGEVNPVDFIAIETIRVFSTYVYQLIQKNPDMFAGAPDSHSSSKTDDKKPFHDKWVEQISEEQREVIKKLLLRIFPKLGAIFGNTHYGGEWESTWRKQLRICSPDIFPIYFRLAVPEGKIANAEMQTLMTLAQNSEAFGNKLLELSKQRKPDGSTRLSTFLERMEDYTKEDIHENDIPHILQALFDVGDKLLTPEDEGRGLFSWGNDVRIGRIMFQLLKRYKTPEERFKIIREVFTNGYAVSMIVGEVATLGQQHGKYGAKKRSDEECLISSEHVEELEKIALSKIRKAAKNDELLKTPQMAHILYGWRNWESDKPVREWVSQVISTDEGLVDFLTHFLSKSQSQGMEDRVAKVNFRLDPKSIEPFVNPADIIERCKNLLKLIPDWLKDDRKIAVETFVKWYDLRAQGKNPDHPWEWEE